MDISKIPIVPVKGEFSTLDSGSDLAEDDPIVSALQAELDTVIAKNAFVRRLFDDLASLKIPGVVFGGWARDHIAGTIERAHGEPRDLDIVVGEVDISTLLDRLDGIKARPTIFGGINFSAEDFEVDLWPLGKTFIFERYGIAPSFNRLVNISDFTVNAVVFKPIQLWGRPSVRDSGCIDSLRDAVLKFQYINLSFPRIQVARIFIYAAKLHLQIDSNVERFVKDQLRSAPDTKDIELGIRKYCPPESLVEALKILSGYLD